jgi:hypothetical protein
MTVFKYVYVSVGIYVHVYMCLLTFSKKLKL